MDYDALKSDLQEIVELAAEDLYAEYTEEGPTRREAERRFEQEAVGGSFESWAELYARRGAVLFVLRSMMLRVLADMKLWEPARIKEDFSREAFNDVAPHLGHESYFRWIYRDAAETFPELFGETFIDLATPSTETCSKLWDLWRQRDTEGTGELVYQFDGENGVTRFIGDLYQDLDEHVKDHYAMVQTPEFVEEFILDHSFDPALEEFGLEPDDPGLERDPGTIRCIDPACGSGHFLVGLLKRLFDAFADKYPDREPLDWAKRALDGVYGADINDYAAALARFRLLLESAALCRERGQELNLDQLRELDEHVNVIATDSLIPWEDLQRGQGEMWQDPMERLDADYGPPDVRARSSVFFADGPFHVVVGNPPYITVKDEQKKTDYRNLYESAYKEFALTTPFLERFVELSGGGDEEFAGYEGLIVGNNFMKRSFGKKLVEEFVPNWDLTGVVDSSGAYIPGHGTPTVVLFGRARPPVLETLKAVLGKRGEPEVPDRPSEGNVWSAIEKHIEKSEWENQWIEVATLKRKTFGTHPWTLQGGGKVALQSNLEEDSDKLANYIHGAGFTAQTNADRVFRHANERLLPGTWLRPLVVGENIRDWRIATDEQCVFPYDQEVSLRDLNDLSVVRFLWPFKETMWDRATFSGGTYKSEGRPWYEFHTINPARLAATYRTTFAFVATHNHFVLDRGGKVFKQSAPVIKLPEEADEEDHLWLCGLLNSSTACFWMKQVFHNKGYSASGSGARKTSQEFENFYEFTSTGLQDFPLVESGRDEVTEVAKRLDELAGRLDTPTDALEEAGGEREIDKNLATKAHQNDKVRRRMVALQEELDWLSYEAYDILEDAPVSQPALDGEVPLRSEHRPMAIHLARKVERGELETSWFERHGAEPTTEIPTDEYPDEYVEVLEERLALIEDEKFIGLLEQPVYKRRWNWDDWDDEVEDAAENWLLDRIENLFDGGPLSEPRPYTVEEVFAELAGDEKAMEIADIYVDGGLGDPLGLFEKLLLQESVPDNPYRIFSTKGRNAGIDVYEQWRETWNLQERADRDANDGEFPGDQTGTHERTDIDVPVPDKFKKANFAKIYTRVPYQAKTYTQNRVYGHRGRLNVPRERFIHFADASEVMDEPLFGWAGWRDGDRAMAIYNAIELCRTKAFYPVDTPTIDDPRMVGLALALEDNLDDLRRWESEAMEREFRLLFEDYLGGAESVSDELLEAYLEKVVRPGKNDGFDPADVHEADEEDETDVDTELLHAVRDHLSKYGDDGRTLRTLGDDFESDGWEPRQVRRALEVLYHRGDADRDGRGLNTKYWLTDTE